MKKTKANILIINGSIRGTTGNSGGIVKKAVDYINQQKKTTCSVLTLTEPISSIASVKDLLEEASGFLIISGTYWNNWGSPLQRFIEVMSAYENTSLFFGKPVACVVSLDSVGGFEVASRLHAVFCGFGCWSPPCSTLVISRLGQEAVNSTAGKEDDPNEDVWRLDDIKVVLNNLMRSTGISEKWQQWPIEQLKLKDGPWPATGVLELGGKKFL